MKLDIARAWKDEAYRQSLSSEELALLPENPAGELELNDTELDAVYGGRNQQNAQSGYYCFVVSQNQSCNQYTSQNCYNSNASNCLNSQSGYCNSFNCIQSAAICNNSAGNCNSFLGACNRIRVF